MAEEPSQSVPDELRTVMDAEIHLKDLRTDAGQAKLHEALTALTGVESVNFDVNKVSIRYDPEKVVQSELCEAVIRAGFQVIDSEGAPAAPPIEPTQWPETQNREQEQ